jgi:hypothetical protein
LNSPPTFESTAATSGFHFSRVFGVRTNSVKPHRRAVFTLSSRSASQTLQPCTTFRSQFIANSGTDPISENDSRLFHNQNRKADLCKS